MLWQLLPVNTVRKHLTERKFHIYRFLMGLNSDMGMLIVI
jgi:hypothetical protein